MKHEVAGDPCTGLKWTRRTTHKIARELRAGGIAVSARTVARLLKKLRFSLRINRKMIGRGSRPDRDEQFTYIARLRTRFAQRHRPIVSIDSKKKEMVGMFKNGSTVWNRDRRLVRDHDFRSRMPRGWRSPTASTTSPGEPRGPSSSASPTTPRLRGGQAVGWWPRRGARRSHRGATEAARPRRWGRKQWPRHRALQYGLQTQGDRCTSGHRHRLPLPAGASKWNPIEHRLFARSARTGRRAPGPLRDGSQLHPHHADGHRVTCQSPSRHEAIHYRCEDLPGPDENDRPSATQGPAPTELHPPPNHMNMKPQNRDLFLRGG